ncbi:basement membrane-specific heparan sulfate proteoglycan core protein-like isoform X1 [Conger conger]|uniref:basement membrane-specific heparan sulfate proteoglycan core protein-like isoform X1 n=1 Tax=Conger conger TaxID=82655 RepID=UPI002A59B7FF|nr:basement membrane-specific heparan sulfate proteoglycan core protein-like isoform X1 [Conger conger]
METRIALHRFFGLVISSVAILNLINQVACGSRSWGDVALPEDLEAGQKDRRWRRFLAESDDEDFALEDYSGDGGSGDEDGSTPEPSEVTPTPTSTPTPTPAVTTIYYRALVNFTHSFDYSPALEDIYSDTFQEISDVIVDTLESLYSSIAGFQTISVVLIKKVSGHLFVELDVGSDFNSNDKEIRNVLYTAVKKGTLAPYTTSVEGFQFRRLGEVVPSRRACMEDEFMCVDGSCILLEYLCDKRPDCLDMSDELDCDEITSPDTSPAPTITTPDRKSPQPSLPGACRVDQARCPSGECIPRDYLCDGEKDCPDGSDEIKCGTPSPCEPNEFKCQNGRCALKLWRCDGDNDCGDHSDESYCPTKGPGDTCAPEQFVCLSDHTCIPASYQCDEEPDCADRSDEVDCTPPVVTTAPEELISVPRGGMVTFTCLAVGVPTPIITWRLNWGHIPTSSRITMTSENGHGTLVIRDVKDPDQGAYTCEAINAKGMVFGIPDGILSLNQRAGSCPDGEFSSVRNSRCVSCFCFGITRTCQSSGRQRGQVQLRFDKAGDFKGVNVTYPTRPATPPLSSNQFQINLESQELQLVDLSRRFLSLDSHWSLPRQFLGNKIDSYGGFLRYKVRYTLPRGETEPQEKAEVVLVGNGQRLIYRRSNPTPPRAINQKAIKFTEEHWQHSSGLPVTRQDLMMTLVKLDGINIRTMYDKRMVTLSLSDISMDTTSAERSSLGPAPEVEECRCPKGYSGLSCEECAAGFERVPGGSYLGTCAGCNCNGHASTCDPASGHCLNCRHNTEGPACDKCRPGFFGNPLRGRSDDCKPCPCPHTETTRRFSATCFLDHDSQATCDACRTGYTGRRCERCALGYQGNPLQPNGKCVPNASSAVIPSRLKCDSRGVVNSNSSPCSCKANVEGALCDKCKPSSFHLSEDNPEGCLQCFCMGVSKTCASSTWNRGQVQGGTKGQIFALSDGANTRTITEGIVQKDASGVAFRSFGSIPKDIYYWVLPESFRGDKVTAYGGELRYTVRFEPRQRFVVTTGQPDVILQGNGIFLEHFSKTRPAARTPTTITVRFRESAWKRADGQPCTREHLLMALAETAVFMIRATYADSLLGTSISDIQMDIAVPHSTGRGQAMEVEECACPRGYKGPSCQECDEGYTRTGAGLYLGTCEECDCNGHGSSCDPESGECLECLHNTAGPNCERCMPGFYGDPKTDGVSACQPCPCPGISPNDQYSKQCYLDSDNQPTCDSCPPGFTGRRCERCSAGYTGNPLLGLSCTFANGHCESCDRNGSDGCDENGLCLCKAHTQGPSCSVCKPGFFHLSFNHKDGCLPCFCMGVSQQCLSSPYYRHTVSSSFSPGDFQGFVLVNRQHTDRVATGFTVEVATDGTQLSFSHFRSLQPDPYYWQLPVDYQGDKVGSYGGRLRYTLSYVMSSRGTHIDDTDIQIIGNDITLVARLPWPRTPGVRQSREFEIIFREEYWRRLDGMPATREHLMMVLSDLEEVLIRASHYTSMLSASISGVSMEVARPTDTGGAPALEVEQCLCPHGYQGLSCQDCAVGYTRTGTGLYLGHCEVCECNGHSDSCHPETGICTSCLHNAVGELCEQCAPGFYGDATTGTPEDCQPCACPYTDPDNQFSPSCEALSSGGYQCTACLPGYVGQYCERCAPGFVGNPQERVKCRPYGSNAASLQVRVYPERVLVSQGSPVTLRCQVTSSPPHYYYWTREDGRPLPSNAETRSSQQSEELYFSSVQPSDAGVYICTCRDQHGTNRSRAQIVVTTGISKPIEVLIEEPKAQSVNLGSTVSFICTAKSTSPAYTLVWTRRNNGKLPTRAMDFNGILTIQDIQTEDAGMYVCTASNMFAMDESTAILYVPEASQTQMFYTAYEMFEGHRAPAGGSQPQASISPPGLTIQQGQRAEFHCTVTGTPTPAVEWSGGQGNRISPSAIIRGGVLIIPAVERSDEAEYFCRALNTHGEHRARAVLYVHSASLPHVQVSPRHVEVREGETMRLYCRAGGTPSPDLTWRKKDGPLPPQARMERTDIGTLLIPDIRASDSGTFLCVGTNSIGSSEAPVQVTVVPGDTISSVIRIHPSIASVQEGQSLDLSCIVPGNPPPSVTWQRVGRPLSSNHKVLGSQLRILQASEADSGEYICQVDGGPVLKQASVSVSVTSSSTRLQTPIISIEPHSTSVRLGESMSFRCLVHNGAQPMRLEWKMSNGQALQDNVKIGPDGSAITIVRSRPSNQGTYRCSASNLFGITQSMASLIVKEPPKVTLTPRGVVLVKVGEPINLECKATGEPRPSVRWHRHDTTSKTILNSPVPMESNAVMQVLAARPEDSGTYGCTAENSEGSVELKVVVMVQGGTLGPSAPRASVPEPLMVVVEGQAVTLHCDAHGHPIPTITWSKLRSPLPWKHKVVNNSLVLPSIGRQDSGQYICNATNSMGTSEVTITLDVETPPYTTILPDDLSVRVGEVIRLQCLGHGTPPLRFDWTKVDGSMPAKADMQAGDLQINLATEADAGSYRCRATNKVGSSEALAKVTVTSPLAVRVSPQVEVKSLGSSVEFTCSANGDDQTTVMWLKEGGDLPPKHHITDGVLRMDNLEQSDAGFYICRATSVFGQAQDTAKLTIQALPKVMINIRTSVQTVMLGNSVEFECQAVGDPTPTVRWSKVGGSLPAHVEVRGGMLKIPQVKDTDAGHYRCTATNDVGSVQSQVVLNVQSLPQITAQPEVKDVTLGSTAVFPCLATGYPVPEVKWSKMDEDLPSKAVEEGNVLTIPDATAEDMGMYVCTASNKQGKVQAFSTLRVHERVVPYFTQTPLSYLTLPTIKNSYKAFNIKITFRPDTTDGVVLFGGMMVYNGQRKTTGADFISLGLVGGRPEFRFDVGSGMATIRYPTPLKLGEFHTVEIHRNQTQGSLVVDGEAPVNGSSQGKFQGLDLNEELYVGGYPNYSLISQTTGLKSGFVGCIRQLIIQGDEVIFKVLDRSSTGVSNCPTCKDRPCQNGGVCRDSETSSYKCDCARGFTGSNCEHHSALHCHPEACGPDATCINRPNGLGYDCRCHLGRSGDKCMEGTLVTTPAFDGEDSFIAYPPLTNIHNDLRVELEFRPLDQEGLMFFSGGKKTKVEDFVSLSLVDSHVEFRYELGTGMAVLRSQEPVTLEQWHRVTAERLNKDGFLKVDQAPEVRRSSPGKAQGLNIHTPMYLGGVPSMDILPKAANISMLFEGCIGEVRVNGKKVDLSYSFLESQAVGECSDSSPCERRPCLHGGTCLSSSEHQYRCLCQDGFQGERCEVVKDSCQHSAQCLNGGSCSSQRCVCAPGYTGLFCESDSPAQYAAYFHDDGYLTLPKPIFPRSSPDAPETMELEIRTVSSEGLVLWQGVEPTGAFRKLHARHKELGDQGKGKDFISLGLKNGHLVFSYQLGSGEAEIISKEPINDGNWHKLTAVRTGKQGYLQVDGGAPRKGQSQGRMIMVDTKGNIFLGGAPDMTALTGGKFSSGITGCVKNLVLTNARPGKRPFRPLDLRAHAEDGINVERCLS